ncbi:MAG: hypothetical protein RLZZ232_3622 [Planctomycetota bacterium]
MLKATIEHRRHGQKIPVVRGLTPVARIRSNSAPNYRRNRLRWISFFMETLTKPNTVALTISIRRLKSSIRRNSSSP